MNNLSNIWKKQQKEENEDVIATTTLHQQKYNSE